MKSLRILALSLLLFLLLATWIIPPHSSFAHDQNPREVPALPEDPAGKAGQFSGQRFRQPPKVEPQLLRRLLDGEPGAQHRVVVDLVQQADLASIPAAMSREQRGSLVVSELQQTARKAQAPLLAFLGQQRQSVQRVRSFWIFNGLAVTANADTILEIATRPEVSTIREDRWLPWLDPLSVAETPDT
nr:hypothetical protein [Anaerolineae bacterium]